MSVTTPATAMSGPELGALLRVTHSFRTSTSVSTAPPIIKRRMCPRSTASLSSFVSS
jgi:hypothetical protein